MSTLSIPNPAVTLTTISSSDYNGNNSAIEAWANGNIDDANLLNLGITASDKLANNSINQAKMGLLSVGTPELIALAVTNAKLALLAVDTGQLAAGAVEREKIGDNEVTRLTANSNTGATTLTGSYQTIDTSTLFTGEGKPVLIALSLQYRTSVGATGPAGIDLIVEKEEAGGGWTTLQEWLNAQSSNVVTNVEEGSIAKIKVDTAPSAGTLQYRVRAKEQVGTHASATVSIETEERTIVALELKNEA